MNLPNFTPLYLNFNFKYTKMSYAYLFKYIIIGDTGERSIDFPLWEWNNKNNYPYEIKRFN